MKEFWNQRYGQSAYIYGEAPNEFFKEQVVGLRPGRAMFPAEGEGRNAIYAATLGWKSDAFDLSEKGKEKAEHLAARFHVSINYQLYGYEDWQPEAESYDLVVLCYTHCSTALKQQLFANIRKALKPGGSIILETFSKNQLGRTSGGPKEADLLYDTDMLAEAFKDFKISVLEETETELQEGSYHSGVASVIRLVAKK